MNKIISQYTADTAKVGVATDSLSAASTSKLSPTILLPSKRERPPILLPKIRPKPFRSSSFPLPPKVTTVLERLRSHHYSPNRWDEMGLASSKNMAEPLQKPIRRPSPVQKAMNAMDTAAMIVQYEDDEEPESFYSDVKSLSPRKSDAMSFDERQQLWLDEVMSTVCQAKVREETKATTRTTNFAEQRKLDERGYCKAIFPTRHENPIRRYCLDPTTTAEITKKAGLLLHERQLVACRIVARTNL